MDHHSKPIRIGADVGGTFTDVVLIDDAGKVWTHKLPSTPPDFEQAVLAGIGHLLGTSGASGQAVGAVAHGTTVATNAVLERRGAKTALITTRGFRDVLELRRIRAPQIYDLFFDKPPALIERFLRYELNERITAQGEVLHSIDSAELEELGNQLEQEQVESIAVCFIHAYAYAQHERQVGEFLRQRLPAVQVSLSSDVLPERREYERTATTAVNAYVRPVMQNYLGAMHQGLNAIDIDAPLLIMQSAGGLSPEEETGRRPVFMLESGPAAGVLAASFTAQRLELTNVITLDMGGTTAKASMIEEGTISYSPQYEVGASLSSSSRLVGGGGELIRAPTIDIAEVGAGGGSIAHIDSGGGLRVGPRSAGALPGPACYQRGGVEPTLTDANVALGYIRPGKLADGEVEIDLEAAQRAVSDHIATPLGLDLLAAAEGIHRIANARTMRALREVSTERGRDPRNFVLLAFGGAGPIHAAGLARELNIGQVIVPPLPGLFSALGLLFSGVEHHDVRSCLLSGDDLTTAALQKLRLSLEQSMLAQFAAEGYTSDQVTRHYSADVRFRGQTSDVRIALTDGPLSAASLQQLQDDFADEHERLYGHRADPDNPIEVVALRLVGRAGTPQGDSHLEPAESAVASTSSRPAYFGAQWGTIDTPVCRRRDLTQTMQGPLLIDEYDSTIVVPPAMRAYLDAHLNIRLEPTDV
jgi:N-methylhydantoinase A